MRINKNYDIGKLVEELRKEINDAKKPPCKGTVKLDILLAKDILDVLEETQRREQKHQTLESALTFIEKEDGTQTNEMELKNKVKRLKCFEQHDGGDMECFTCDNEKQCIEMTNRLKLETGCFGGYEEGEINCKNCEYNKECKIESIEETKTI